MAKFQANGFKIDEDDPQIPLSEIMGLMRRIETGPPHEYYSDEWLKNGLQFLNFMLNEFKIPIHILAETDQSLYD